MSSKRINFLETYKQTSLIPFDSTGTSIAFTFKHDVSESTQINISWHLIIAVIFSTLYICSSICFCFLEATTFAEYLDSFFPTVSLIVALCSCILQIIVGPKMIEVIDKFEMVIEKRTSIQQN